MAAVQAAKNHLDEWGLTWYYIERYVGAIGLEPTTT